MEQCGRDCPPPDTSPACPRVSGASAPPPDSLLQSQLREVSAGTRRVPVSMGGRLDTSLCGGPARSLAQGGLAGA